MKWWPFVTKKQYDTTVKNYQLIIELEQETYKKEMTKQGRLLGNVQNSHLAEVKELKNSYRKQLNDIQTQFDTFLETQFIMQEEGVKTRPFKLCIEINPTLLLGFYHQKFEETGRGAVAKALTDRFSALIYKYIYNTTLPTLDKDYSEILTKDYTQ